MAATKKNELSVSEVPEEEEEYTGLVYNQWWNITGDFIVNIADGGTFIMQTGRPKDPGPPPGTP